MAAITTSNSRLIFLTLNAELHKLAGET